MWLSGIKLLLLMSRKTSQDKSQSNAQEATPRVQATLSERERREPQKKKIIN